MRPHRGRARQLAAGRRWRQVLDQPAGRSLLVLSAALLLGFAIGFAPLDGIEPWAQRVLGIVTVALVLWISEALNIAITSLLVIGLLALFGPGESGEATRQALYGFQLSAGYFILITLVIAVAATKTGLAGRIARLLTARTGADPWRIYSRFLMLMPPFALLLPSAITRNAILIPGYEQVYRRFDIERGGGLAKTISLAMALLQASNSTAVLTGGVVPITAAFLLGGFSWVEWFIYMAVPNYAIFLAAGVLFYLWQRPKMPVSRTAGHFSQHPRAGRWSPDEVRAGLVIAGMTVLWLTDFWTGWDPLIPALLGGVVLFVPGLGVLTWKDFDDTSPWGLFLVTGSSLSMAYALETSGAAAWLGRQFLDYVPLEGIPLIPTLLALFLLIVPVNLIVPNRAGVLGILIPLLTTISTGIGIDPRPVGLVATILAQTTTFFPVQNPTALLVYQARHFDQLELLKAGLLLFAVSTVVLIVVALPWWSLVGLPLRP